MNDGGAARSGGPAGAGGGGDSGRGTVAAATRQPPRAAKAPWERRWLARGCGTSAARFSSSPRGSKRIARVPARHGRRNRSSARPCFRDEDERRRWFEHQDDLTVDSVVSRMVDDLRARGTINGDRPSDHELVEIINDSYIKYPAARPVE